MMTHLPDLVCDRRKVAYASEYGRRRIWPAGELYGATVTVSGW
jgi:hypothetical protein